MPAVDFNALAPFGMAGFGVVALILLYRFVIAPMLAMALAIANEQRAASENLKQTAATLATHTTALTNATDRVERAADRMEHLSPPPPSR